MKARGICDKMNDFLVEGYVCGAFLAFQAHVLQGPEERKTLGPASDVAMISRDGVAMDEFLAILDGDGYSAVFHDGAIVIVQCRFSIDRLIAHRYVYIPCPIDQALIDIRPAEITLADWMREIAMAPENKAFRSRGTYRFDYSNSPPPSSSEPHPASHLTFGSAHCRLPARAPLSPSGFFDLLFQNFYRSFLRIWTPISPHLQCAGTEDSISGGEKLLHHLHWADAT
jgi:hypothetical protein